MGVHNDNKNAARAAISGLIDSLKAESDRIGSSNPIPPHTLKQMIHDIAKLHEQAVIYSYLERLPADVRQETVVEKVVAPEAKAPEPVAEKVVVPEVKQPEVIVEKVVVPQVKPEPVVVPEVKAPEPMVEKIIPPEVKKPEPVVEKIVPPEMKQPEPVKNIPPVSPGKQRPDIKSLIGLNEKLMFQRYLFAGDGAAYEEALKQINASASAEEADTFISVISGTYKWNADSEPVQAFLSIVKRRFA